MMMRSHGGEFMAARSNREPSAQPQVSLTGRAAWVVSQLVKIRGVGEAEALRWVLDRWVDGEGREYLRSYDIDLKDYYLKADIVPIGDARG
jgi:hypothetical protein